MDARETCEAIVQAVRQQTVGLELRPPHDYYLVGGHRDRRVPGVNDLINYVQKNGDGPWWDDDDSLRGDAVHAAIASDVPAEYMADESIAGYRRGWEEWCEESGFIPMARELPVVGWGTTSQDKGVVPLWAGTIDSFGFYERGPFAGDLGVVDGKSHRTKLPASPAPRWPDQVTGYMVAITTVCLRSNHLLPDWKRIHRTAVSLAPDGTHKEWLMDDYPIIAWGGLVARVQYRRGRRYWSKP